MFIKQATSEYYNLCSAYSTCRVLSPPMSLLCLPRPTLPIYIYLSISIYICLSICLYLYLYLYLYISHLFFAQASGTAEEAPLSPDAPKAKRLSFAPRMPLSKRTEYSGPAPVCADAPQPEEGPTSPTEGPAPPAEGSALEAAAEVALESATEADPLQQGAHPPQQGAHPPAADSVAEITSSLDNMFVPDAASPASLRNGAQSPLHSSLHSGRSSPSRSARLSYDEVAAAAAAQGAEQEHALRDSISKRTSQVRALPSVPAGAYIYIYSFLYIYIY